MDEKIKAVYELLKANNIYASVYQYGQLPLLRRSHPG